MLKRVFGQNNEKNNFTVRKINFSCTNMPSLRCKHRSTSANMNMGYAKLQYSPLLNMTRKVCVNTDVRTHRNKECRM